METHSEQKKTLKPPRTVREVMDEEFMTNGDGFGKIWTREELDDHHRVGNLLDEKLALGYTVEQINAEWKGKSDKEILAEAGEQEAMPRTSQRWTRKPTTLNTMPQQK